MTEEIIRIFYRVYNKLGLLCYGFLEKVYENAMRIERKKDGFPAVSQYAIKALYEGEVIGESYADILVENKVIVEIKAASSLVKKPEVKRKAFDNLRK